MREVLFTECYSLVDALIWWGMGLALGLELMRGGRKKHGKD